MQHFGFNPALDILIAVVLSVFGSSGFWVYLQKRQERRSANTRLLLGMAHDRIVYVGKTYIHGGSLTRDVFEDFMMYHYEPFAVLGGKGLA